MVFEIFLISVLVHLVSCQSQYEPNLNSLIKTEKEYAECQCMDYWQCVERKGDMESYCGISETDVCCFLNNYGNSSSTKAIAAEMDTKITSTSDAAFEEATTDVADVGTTLKDFEIQTTEPLRPTVATFTDTFDPSSSEESGESLEEDSCGVPSIPTVLDSKAEFREWPWHVAILEASEDLYICGGSIISPNRVLTAAHCVSSYLEKWKGMRKLKVRAGEYDISGNHEEDPHIEVGVDLILIHPSFDKGTLRNDIAIVGLTDKLNFTKNIQPICLPQRRKRGGSRRQCVVTGWGRTSEDSAHSIILKEVVAPLWGQRICEERLRGNFGSGYKLPSSTICAGDQGSGGKGGICDGDGGSPLVCKNPSGKWSQEGIVSFGVGCRQDSPGIYTRVASYLKFIGANK